MSQAASERRLGPTVGEKVSNEPVYARRPGLESRTNGHLTLLERIQMDSRFQDVPAGDIFFLGPYHIYPFSQNNDEKMQGELARMRQDKQQILQNGVQIDNVVYEVNEGKGLLQTQFASHDASGKVLVGILSKPILGDPNRIRTGVFSMRS